MPGGRLRHQRRTLGAADLAYRIKMTRLEVSQRIRFALFADTCSLGAHGMDGAVGGREVYNRCTLTRIDHDRLRRIRCRGGTGLAAANEGQAHDREESRN